MRRHAGTVYRLAYAQLRSKPDADDVFQEVFFRYFRSHPVFDSEEHAKAWLIRVTLNCCKNMWQSPWRKDAPLPEELPALSREESQLEDALQSLPGKYRILLFTSTITRVMPQMKLLKFWASAPPPSAPSWPVDGPGWSIC